MAYNEEDWTWGANAAPSVHTFNSALYVNPVSGQTGITATGVDQSDAYQLLGPDLAIVTTAAAGTGVKLPAMVNGRGGLKFYVYNGGANALKCYPASGDKIIQLDGTDLTANVAHSIATNTWAAFVDCGDGLTWRQLPST